MTNIGGTWVKQGRADERSSARLLYYRNVRGKCPHPPRGYTVGTLLLRLERNVMAGMA